jgi:hypothetical protein
LKSHSIIQTNKISCEFDDEYIELKDKKKEVDNQYQQLQVTSSKKIEKLEKE